MIVKDTLTLNVPNRVSDEALNVAIDPEYRGKYLAIQFTFHGSKRAAIVNPSRRDALDAFEWVIELASTWLLNDFGYTNCRITTA